MKRGKLFENDFQEVLDIFPKLKSNWNPKNQGWYIRGDLDICDTQGAFWGTFNILIIVSHLYPYCQPVVKEVSQHIKRKDEWHISANGVCCLDIDHKMQFLAKRGINIFDFMHDYVYPYFANQLHKIKTGKYAGEEYKHHFDGIRQFYSEDLNINDPKTAILILEAILNGTIPERNEKCLCEKAKFKKCHLHAIEFLERIPQNRLILDLEEFIKYERIQ